MATDIGGIFEKEMQKVLKHLRETHFLGWHRFADTAAAGGSIIQEQPSDYLITLPPGSNLTQRQVYLEVKASEKHRGLVRSFIRPSQRGAIHFMSGLLEVPYLIMFWDTQGHRIEVWHGLTALEGASIAKQRPFAVIDHAGSHLSLNITNVAARLVDIFNLPDKSVTLAAYKERTE